MPHSPLDGRWLSHTLESDGRRLFAGIEKIVFLISITRKENEEIFFFQIKKANICC